MLATACLPTGGKHQPGHFSHLTDKLTTSELTALPEDNKCD